MRRRRSRRKEYTQLTFFLVPLSNPAPAAFRYSKEDEGGVRRRERGCKKIITVSKAPVPFYKPLETQRGDDRALPSRAVDDGGCAGRSRLRLRNHY